MRKVGHCIKHVAARHDCETYAIHFRIEQVFAMVRRVHPSHVDGARLIAFGDVLFDQVEVRPCMACALAQVGFARVLMRERPFSGHADAMIQRSRGQCRVPFERSQSLGRARLIAQRK